MIPLRYIQVAIMVLVIHNNITFVTARVRDRMGSGSGIFMGFMGVRTSTKGRKGFSITVYFQWTYYCSPELLIKIYCIS